MTDDFKGHHSKSEMRREEIMNAAKPREWWIDVSKPSAEIKELGETRKFDGVHVIEYSAYEAACKERDTLRHKLSCAQHYLDDHAAACQRADLAERERDEARAEVERLTNILGHDQAVRFIDNRNEHRESVGLKALLTEARAELETCNRSITRASFAHMKKDALLAETAAALEMGHQDCFDSQECRDALRDMLTKLKSHMAGGGE